VAVEVYPLALGGPTVRLFRLRTPLLQHWVGVVVLTHSMVRVVVVIVATMMVVVVGIVVVEVVVVAQPQRVQGALFEQELGEVHVDGQRHLDLGGVARLGLEREVERPLALPVRPSRHLDGPPHPGAPGGGPPQPLLGGEAHGAGGEGEARGGHDQHQGYQCQACQQLLHGACGRGVWKCGCFLVHYIFSNK